MNSRLSEALYASLVRASHSLGTLRSWSTRILVNLAGLCAGLMVVSAQAAFQSVEDFDGLTLANINGQNGWVAKLTSGEVVIDPADSENQVLKVSTESGTIYKGASVAQGTTRMLFLRLRFAEHGRYSFGLSPLLAPDEYSDFGPELGMAAATASDPANEFRVANSLSTETYDVLTSLVPGTWYNIWVLVNTDSDTYEVWLNADGGGDAQAADKLSNDAAQTLFGFRAATNGDLFNFYIKTGGGTSPANGRFYIDDIYLENTSNTNLSNPTVAGAEPIPSDPVPPGPVDPAPTDPVDPAPTDAEAAVGFQAVEIFDNLTLGDIDGQNGWVVSLTNGEVVLDPAGGSNQALEVGTESGTLYTAASVAEGTTRMLFLRLRFAEHGRYSFGLSPLLTPDEYSDFGPELGMAAATASDPANELRVANSLSTETYDVLTTLVPGTWYNIWVLMNTDSDTYEVWLNADPGGNAQAGDKLSNDAAETLFGFRAATSGDLFNFYIKTGGGDSPAGGRFYIDDIYLENSDAINLSNPLSAIDSNGDGISDADAIALGLDPNDPDGDTDGDGVSDVLETGGDPRLPMPVDSDGDSVIDALEPDGSAIDASVASGLRLPGGDTVTITTDPDQLLSEVSAAAAGETPAGISFPFGSISYTTGAPVGGSVTTRITFSAELPILLALYKVDHDGVYTELPTTAWALVDPRTVDITLTDGDPETDLDGEANGWIVDPIAPAAVEPIVGNDSGGGADPILPLLLLATLGYLFRQRRRQCPSATARE